MFEQLFSMQGKICVITGGARGLGSFIARGFLEAGAKRVYISARNEAAGVEMSKELSVIG
jgi:NAD(P)-dependent dehydrogenase (short-subunit alcohol dehydrogenase family)